MGIKINELHPFFRKLAIENAQKQDERKGNPIRPVAFIEEEWLINAFLWVNTPQNEIWSVFDSLSDNRDPGFMQDFQGALMETIYKYESGNTQYIKVLQEMTNELLMIMSRIKEEGFTEELQEQYEQVTKMFNVVKEVDEKIDG
jgi:hypothetical protein